MKILIKIGEFSKIAKTTIKTLRYYDDINLFKPAFVDENCYRYYELSQLKELLKIIELRNLDLSIENILDIFNKGDELEILANHYEKIKQEKKRKEKQLTSLKKLIKGEEVKMKLDYKIKTIEQNIVYYRHGVISSMDKILDFILDTGKRCSEINPTLKCKDYCYITYSAKEYKEKDIEIEHVEAVDKFGVEGNEIKFRCDKKIKALCVLVKGSYTNLIKGYEFALTKVKENNYEIVGPIREVYIHGCWDENNEDNYLTEIQIPIE